MYQKGLKEGILQRYCLGYKKISFIWKIKEIFVGAANGTWTHTLSHTPLKRACLPIPALPHLDNNDIISESAEEINSFFWEISKNFFAAVDKCREAFRYYQ